MFDKLRKAISKTSKKISTSLSHILSKENSIDKIRAELEDVLLSADLGAKFTSELINKIKISSTKEEIIDLLRAGIDEKMQKAYFSENINEPMAPEKQLPLRKLRIIIKNKDFL